MDFFAAQDLARRNSRLLILWFAFAVAGIIGAVYVALVLVRRIAATSAVQGAGLWDGGLFLATAAAVGTLILLGSAYKTIRLARGGGASVAQGLGGRLVPRATEDPLERRLLNVVEEMAIASGVPAPSVYVLDAEAGINAFAAGSEASQAVVAVTRGTLEQLSRDELQGVIAHEFSHILNGDMRLNLRLIGVLHGILLLSLAGRLVMRGAHRSDKGAGPVVAMGAALIGIGYLGVLFGKLIKAAVSRQREYLADAAAVQFTRNPGGIAAALRRIARLGSTIGHPRAEEASHLFFGAGGRVSRLFATHPPIEERIRRIAPGFVPQRGEPAPAAPTTTPLGERFTPSAFADSVGEPRPAHVVHARELIASIPGPLIDAARQPAGARAVVFGLLLADPLPVRERQLAALESRFGAAMRDQALTHREWFAGADPAMRLPLLDLAIPALRELSAEARTQLLDAVDELVRTDGRTTLFEYVLRRLLRHGLGQPGRRRAAVGSFAALKADTAHLIALLARAGSPTPEAARAAFRAATDLAPQEGPWEMPGEDGKLEPDAVDRALDHLGAASAAFRRKLVEACAAAVLHDGRVMPVEGELLRAVCEGLDCPVPPLATNRTIEPAPISA